MTFRYGPMGYISLKDKKIKIIRICDSQNLGL